MIDLERITIHLQNHSYDILLGNNLWEIPEAWQDLPKAYQAVIVTNTTVAPLYAKQLETVLAMKYKKIHCIVLPDGEAYKTWESLETIFSTLLTHACDRKTVLYALGGGVVGDMTGFAASCYMRGVPFVQVPTTLLAQVDASVGGKTAINHPLGKNMIGAFYQPQRVLCDAQSLITLPDREWAAGLAEVIKYGPIADTAFFEWLEDHMENLWQRDRKAVLYAVKRSCEIKAYVVSKDEKEAHIRAILNFGHTFGHAIEAAMGYGVWLHGEAVAAGMVLAMRLSVMLGLCDEAWVFRLIRLLERAHLPTQAPSLGEDNAATYLQWMRVDKKADQGDLVFVLVDGTGQACMKKVPDDVVIQCINQWV